MTIATLLAFAFMPAGTPAAPVELARRFVEDFQAERLADMDGYVAPDVSMSMPFAPGGAATLQGRAQTDAYLRSVFDRYRSIRILDPVYTPAADGRTVFVEARGEFEAADGERHMVGYIWAITVENGRITRSRTYTLPLGPARS